MLCILYVTAAGMLLGVVGLLVERALPETAARRWVWCAVIPISVILPGAYRTLHPWSVTQALGHQAAHIESLDPGISQLTGIASVVLIIWGLANALWVSRIISFSRRRLDSRTPAMIDGVPVVVTDSIGPATVGLFRSRVLVPRWVLTLPELQRRYVLRHEEEHRRANDARLLFIASLPLILLPWNLALYWQLRRLCLAVEMDCDNRVVAALGDANAYGQLLLKVAQATSGGPCIQPAFLGRVGTLERRLTALMAPTPLQHFQRFLVPAVALGLLLVVVWMPHPILGPGSHAHLSMTTGATSPR